MIWYILIATFLFVGFYSKRPEKYYKISMCVLFVFTAFRNTNLGDYENKTYIAIYNRVPDIFHFSMEGQEYEFGYTLLNSVAKTIYSDFSFFQVLYTLIAMILLYFVIKQMKFEAREKNLFLFLYFCMRFFINNFIILRQNISNLFIWILVLSGAGIVISIAVIIASAQFHMTSYANLVTVGLYSLIRKLDRTKIFIATIILSIIFLFASRSVINTLVNAFITFAGDKYAKYLIPEGGDVAGFNFVYYLLRILFFAIFYLYYDRIRNEKKKALFYISAIAVILGSINVEIFSRFMEFYMIGIYGIMTLSYQAFSKRSRRVYTTLLYCAMMIIMIRQLIIYGGGYLMEYSLFF